MKALRLHARGGPEQLSYDEDAPKPEPGPGEVLVRVHAAGITPTELTWDETYRYADGRPRLPSTPGHDVSGRVAALGAGAAASGLAVGDDVFGLVDFPRDGSAAEYVAVPADDLTGKPRSIDHTQAAAVPLSALTAWQALFDHAALGPGQRVLVHGAARGRRRNRGSTGAVARDRGRRHRVCAASGVRPVARGRPGDRLLR